MPRNHPVLACLLGLFCCLFASASTGALFSTNCVFPGAGWATRPAEAEKLRQAQLKELASFIGGNGVVVRHGYLVHRWGNISAPKDIHSACKPFSSTLLMQAVEKGLLGSVDDRVAEVLPELAEINEGTDAEITWRQLACMTSGYGSPDAPGEAWAYNDYGISLFVRTLAAQVYGAQEVTAPFQTEIFTPLGMQDHPYCVESGNARIGRMRISPRDLARFGLLAMTGGWWKNKQLVRRDLMETMLSSPVSATLPRSAFYEIQGSLVTGGQSFGGGINQDCAVPGLYSFTWWLNQPKPDGRRYLAGLPQNSFLANGLYLCDGCLVIPSWQLVIAWNSSRLSEEDGDLAQLVKRVRACVALKVKFDANGGTGTMGAQTFYPATSQPLRANAFKRSGNVFAGWANSPKGAVLYTNCQAVTVGSSKTLYARWRRPRHKVVFDANGGSGTMKAQSFKYGTAQALFANAFRRTGCTFAGWSRTRTGKVEFKNKQQVKNLTGKDGKTITFYAIWAKAPTKRSIRPAAEEDAATRWLMEYGFLESSGRPLQRANVWETRAANGRTLRECYVAGLDPRNSRSALLVTIQPGETGPVVDWQPKPRDGVKRLYVIEGAETLAGPWTSPTNASHRFFRVKVALPQ